MLIYGSTHPWIKYSDGFFYALLLTFLYFSVFLMFNTDSCSCKSKTIKVHKLLSHYKESNTNFPQKFCIASFIEFKLTTSN